MLRTHVVLRRAASCTVRLQPSALHVRHLPKQLRTMSTAPSTTEKAAALAESAIAALPAAVAGGAPASTAQPEAADTPSTADSAGAASNGSGSKFAEPELRGFQRDAVIRSGPTASNTGAESGRGSRLYFQLAMCVAVPAAAWWAWHRYRAVKGERLLSKPEEELRKLIADVEKLGPGRASLCIARSDLALLMLEAERVEEAHREINRALADIHAARGDAHYLTRRCKVIRDVIAGHAQRRGIALPEAETTAPAVAPAAPAAAPAVPEYTGWRALFVKALTPIFGPPRPPTATA